MTNATTQTTVKVLFWQAITPVHSGTGQTSASVIDLPIAREKATDYPVLPASSIKGVLRDGKQDETAKGRFGSPEAVGDLTFTDARILCLPVRSYAGTFAYVSCPHILRRLDRDRVALGLAPLFDLAEVKAATPTHDPTAGMLPQGLTAAAPTQATPTDPVAQVSARSGLIHAGKVLFEDIDLVSQQSDVADRTAQAIAAAAGLDESFATRFAIVPDDIFAFFSETATEVSAHVRLNAESKTVETGGLWYEEAIPAETLFSSFVISARGQFEVLDRPYVQLGGKGSVGKGLLKVSAEGGL